MMRLIMSDLTKDMNQNENQETVETTTENETASKPSGEVDYAKLINKYPLTSDADIGIIIKK